MLKTSHCAYTNIPKNTKSKKLKSWNISGPSISDKEYATITLYYHSFFVIHFSKRSEILVQNTNKYHIRKQARHENSNILFQLYLVSRTGKYIEETDSIGSRDNNGNYLLRDRVSVLCD